MFATVLILSLLLLHDNTGLPDDRLGDVLM